MIADIKTSPHVTLPLLSPRGLFAWLIAIDTLHRQREHLADLDERMLRDIGITAGDAIAERARPLLADSLLLLRGGNQL